MKSASPGRQYRSRRHRAQCAGRRQSRSDARRADLAQEAGADGITAHLREDRRHISDEDIARLSRELEIPLNLEMAATEEMLAIALKARPHAACIVPEKREERTTEGGIDVVGHFARLKPIVGALADAGIRVSMFIEPDRKPARRVAGTWARRWWNCTPAPMPMPRARNSEKLLKQIHNAAEFGADHRPGNSCRPWPHL